MSDVLERITYFRMKRGWSEYQLAEEAGLTQSTISSWYRKNMVPSIPSLEKICTAFDITLSQFFATEDDLCCELIEVQKILVEETAKLSKDQQTALVAFLKTL